MFTKKKMMVIAMIAIFVMGVLNVFADVIEEYSYSYDSNTSVYTETIDGISYMYEAFYTGNSQNLDHLKASHVQIGSGGWSVDCIDYGTNCWDTVIDTKNKYESL